jgi:hypothetical protein
MLAGGLALVVVTSRGVAGPRVEADPNKLYPITPDAGQWVICAASYTGPNARQLAREVVYQLRRRDNLPAYFFDYSEEERKQLHDYMKDRQGRPRHVRIQDQCGVLIGGYSDPDSARKMLPDIKKLKMPDLDDKSFDSIVDNTGRIIRISPFVNAFVTRNPTLPRAQPANAENYSALKSLNASEDFSLLKNKHAWTLLVKGYGGTSTIQSVSTSSSFVEKLWGTNSKDVLGAAGATAHNFAEVLRSPQFGFESYVLHTRDKSLVTVGGFDSPDDPRLQETRNKLEQFRRRNIEMARGADQLQLAEFFIPMRVPKP